VAIAPQKGDQEKFMKSTIIALALAVLTAIHPNAQAESGNPSKDLVTKGVAALPTTIRLAKDGVVTTYETSSLGTKFYLLDDNYFLMGARTRCAPLMGRTVDDLEVPILIESRAKLTGKYDNQFVPITVLFGETGRLL
jgi:hypothetical protein